MPNLLATGGEDLVVKVSQIPDEGLKAHQSEALVTLEGHERKVNILHFHPTANNILGSSSSDLTIKVWDIEKQTQVLNFNDFTDHVHSFDWNPDGSMIVASSKDLTLRCYDPRTPGSVIKGNAFTGQKTSRALWRGDKGQVIAVGSSKSAARQYGLWDIKMMNQPLTLTDIDSSAGVLLPSYDADTNMLYAAGKGDGNIRYWEVVDSDPYVHFLSEFRDNASQKGVAFLPKRSVDVKQCEVAIAFRLMKDKVIPISFQVPRKSADTFQRDIYPEAYAGVPSLEADQWLSGKNVPPKKISMDPKDKAKGATTASSAPAPALKVQKSPAQLQAELDAANARIAELEKELAALKAK
jgi:coronin-1B/1C/6